MQKIFSYFFILVGLSLIYISTSKTAMKSISDRRNNDNGPFGTFHGRGDLVDMSYLDGVSKFTTFDQTEFKRPADTTNKNVDLYLFGDSYVYFIPDSVYAHVAHFHSGRRDYKPLYYKLDPGKRNILIFENAERFAQLWLSYTFIYSSVMRDTTKADNARIGSPGSSPALAAAFSLSLEDLFNPNINQNLEYNMFNYNLINPVREFKAMLNYKFFNRASGDVVISDDGNQLFLKQTVAERGGMSSFEALDPRIIPTMADTIKAIYQHYKKEGFDEIYISIPPNSASILQPGYYNHLIPLLWKKLDSVGIPYIDDYDQFVNYPDKASLFFPGDTHWSGKGEGIWVDLVNEMMGRESRKTKGK